MSNVCECVCTYLRAGIFTNHVQNVNIISHAADIRCLVVVVVVCDCASVCICVHVCMSELKQLLLQTCFQLLPNWSAIKLLSVYGSMTRPASGGTIPRTLEWLEMGFRVWCDNCPCHTHKGWIKTWTSLVYIHCGASGLPCLCF